METLIIFLMTHAGMIATGAFLIVSLLAAIKKNWIQCLAYLNMSLFMALNYFPPTGYLSIQIIHTVMWISFGFYIFLLPLSVKVRQPLSTKEIDRWNKRQARGQRRFVLVSGGMFGGLMFISMYMGLFCAHQVVATHHPITVFNMLLTAILCLVGGVAYGLAFWSVLEMRYRKTMSNLSDEQ